MPGRGPGISSLTQVYIILNFFLLYAFAYNKVFEYFSKNAAPTALVENFKNDYKGWGYAL